MTYILSIAWLLGLIAAPLAIYLIWIRPIASIRDTAALDGLWETAKRFRTLFLSFVGILITVLPDLLQMMVGIDYQKYLPAPWSIFAGPAVTVALLMVRAIKTTPPDAPATDER